MSHRRNTSIVNPCADVFVADGLVCPACDTAIRPFDVQPLDPWGVRIVCRGCHRDIHVYEPAR